VKSPANRLLFKAARSNVKKVKTKAKNKWLLSMVSECNQSCSPGEQPNPKAIWSFVSKLKRGVDKWKPWNFKNIIDSSGNLGKTPSDNADNFCQFYNDLYANEGKVNGPAETWYKQMCTRKTDREWREPQLHEMLVAIAELKHTAPGLSGVPASLWKAMATNEKMRDVMLDIMQQCWHQESVPGSWLQYYMIVLEKRETSPFQATTAESPSARHCPRYTRRF
jgi:hypothetical protein